MRIACCVLRITRIVAEHRSSLTRFGFNFLKVLTDRLGVVVEIVNEAPPDKEELMQDLISIITSFCARYYGQRISRRKTEKIIAALTADETHKENPLCNESNNI